MTLKIDDDLYLDLAVDVSSGSNGRHCRNSRSSKLLKRLLGRDQLRNLGNPRCREEAKSEE
jgi:hypothetical protein